MGQCCYRPPKIATVHNYVLCHAVVSCSHASASLCLWFMWRDCARLSAINKACKLGGKRPYARRRMQTFQCKDSLEFSHLSQYKLKKTRCESDVKKSFLCRVCRQRNETISIFQTLQGNHFHRSVNLSRNIRKCNVFFLESLNCNLVAAGGQ